MFLNRNCYCYNYNHQVFGEKDQVITENFLLNNFQWIEQIKESHYQNTPKVFKSCRANQVVPLKSPSTLNNCSKRYIGLMHLNRCLQQQHFFLIDTIRANLIVLEMISNQIPLHMLTSGELQRLRQLLSADTRACQRKRNT